MANDNRDELYTGVREGRGRREVGVIEKNRMRRGLFEGPREHGGLLYK